MSILDVGCGYLSDHARRHGIGIDLQRGTCDVVCDCHHLPFKPNVFRKIYARNVVEHFEHPITALHEIRRVMQEGANISITIPIFHNPTVDELLKLLTGSPLRVLVTVKRLMRWRKHRYEKGFWHKNRIQPKHIAELFTVVASEKRYPYHPFGWVLHKLLNSKRIHSPLADVNYIYATKT